MRFNPLTGIRCFLTQMLKAKTVDEELGFNPLTGIRCFLTPGRRSGIGYWTDARFNPLTGIRCFLTYQTMLDNGHTIEGFNPLTGIRCFLTFAVW